MWTWEDGEIGDYIMNWNANWRRLKLKMVAGNNMIPGLIFLVEWKRSPFTYKNGCNRILSSFRYENEDARNTSSNRCGCFCSAWLFSEISRNWILSPSFAHVQFCLNWYRYNRRPRVMNSSVADSSEIEFRIDLA